MATAVKLNRGDVVSYKGRIGTVYLAPRGREVAISFKRGYCHSLFDCIWLAKAELEIF